MPEFVYYEIADDAATPALRKKLFAISNLRMRPNAEATGWLVRSPTPVSRFTGSRVVDEGRWAASLAPRPPVQAGSASPNLIALPWKLAPGTRQARVLRVLIAPKRSALQLTFGAGRGDAVALEVETPVPTGATGLRARLRAPAGTTFDVQPNLRSGRGRPLVSLESKTVSTADSSTLDWALPGLAEEERARIAGLTLTLSTDADEANVFLDALSFNP